MSVPLRRRGGLDGAISVGFFDGRWITEDDVELLTAFAELAGVACRNADDHAAAQRAATLDSLTGCLNHAAFQERLREEIARAERGADPFSLVLLDLEDFKEVNETFGHLSGDSVLRTVGELLRSGVRVQDQVARFGGDEFALLLPGDRRARRAPAGRAPGRGDLRRSRAWRPAAACPRGHRRVAPGRAAHGRDRARRPVAARGQAGTAAAGERERRRRGASTPPPRRRTSAGRTAPQAGRDRRPDRLEAVSPARRGHSIADATASELTATLDYEYAAVLRLSGDGRTLVGSAGIGRGRSELGRTSRGTRARSDAACASAGR